MKSIIMILINIVFCVNALSGSMDDVAYLRLSALSNLWDKSPALYRASIVSNMVDISKNRAIITKDVYSRWMSDFVAYKDEFNDENPVGYQRLYYKSDMLKSYRNVFSEIKSTNVWMEIAMRIGFVRGCLKELETKGIMANVKITPTGRIGDVQISALEIDGGAKSVAEKEKMLKNYSEEKRRYRLLKRIEKDLLDIVFGEMCLEKIKYQLNDREYDEFCSIFAKRAMLTPEEFATIRSNFIHRAKMSKAEETKMFR